MPLRCSGVEVKVSEIGNTQVKYKYLKIVLKYSTTVYGPLRVQWSRSKSIGNWKYSSKVQIPKNLVWESSTQNLDSRGVATVLFFSNEHPMKKTGRDPHAMGLTCK